MKKYKRFKREEQYDQHIRRNKVEDSKKTWYGSNIFSTWISFNWRGTFAYFSDTEETNNTFAAGTLDLTAEPTEIINIDHMKPGDSFIRDFELRNEGSLDIGK